MQSTTVIIRDMYTKYAGSIVSPIVIMRISIATILIPPPQNEFIFCFYIFDSNNNNHFPYLAAYD